MIIKVSHKLLIHFMKSGDKKFMKTHKTFGNINVKKDVQYIPDGTWAHRLDIVYPAENSNGVTLLCIHGGAYVHGGKDETLIYASYFASRGFTVVVMNYRLASAKEKISLKEQIHDVFYCLEFIRQNRVYYKLDTDRFAIIGDSAGGHLSLLTNIIYHDEEARQYFGINRLPDILPKCYALNSPMFDYPSLIKYSRKYMSNKGMKNIFSVNYKDPDYQRFNSPRYYFHKKLDLEPFFASTSLHDFYRFQTVLLIKDYKELGYNFEYIDEQSPDKKIGHVYNHFVFENEGKYCNEKMIEFILKHVG